jgi:hypothetical protein
VAAVEDDRQPRIAVEDPIEVLGELLIANIRNAELRIRRHNGFIELIELARQRILHLGSMACEEKQEHVVLLCRFVKVFFNRRNDRVARRFLIPENENCVRVKAVMEHQELAKLIDVANRAAKRDPRSVCHGRQASPWRNLRRRVVINADEHRTPRGLRVRLYDRRLGATRYE